MANKIKVWLVDDDVVFLKLLQIDLSDNCEFEIETFKSGELCLANLMNKPDIIILDYHLNGIEKSAKNGIQILDEIKAFDINLPVIMLSSQDKIEVAIDCMHHKATDYLIKSETTYMRLQSIISKVFEIQNIKKQLEWYINRM